MSNRGLRITTTPGSSDKSVNLEIKQTYDFLEILSLKITQEDLYRLPTADYGVLVGRVIANGGIGVPNCKISLFIPISEEDSSRTEITNIYPFRTTRDRNNKGLRYNLFKDRKIQTCDVPIGSFPSKRLVLDDNNVLEVFDKYYKYTTETNESGDYMITGVPIGTYTLHMDADLSDIGFLSIRPFELIDKGYNKNQFASNTLYKTSQNLDSLPQVVSQDISIDVFPFWGDDSETSVGISRQDIDFGFEIPANSIFMGSIYGDSNKNSINKNYIPRKKMGQIKQMVSGNGNVEVLRRLEDGSVDFFKPVDSEIDDNGNWAFLVPMNLKIMVTSENGELIPSSNPSLGIPTECECRFRISLDDESGLGRLRRRAKYLVPNMYNNFNFIQYDSSNENFVPKSNTPLNEFDSGIFPTINSGLDVSGNKIYGAADPTDTDNKLRDFYTFRWRKVYTIRQYIPRIQPNRRDESRSFIGLKNIDDGANNPHPFNRFDTDNNFIFKILCLILSLLGTVVAFINLIIAVINRIVTFPCEIKIPCSIQINFPCLFRKIKCFFKRIFGGCDDGDDCKVIIIKYKCIGAAIFCKRLLKKFCSPYAKCCGDDPDNCGADFSQNKCKCQELPFNYSAAETPSSATDTVITTFNYNFYISNNNLSGNQTIMDTEFGMKTFNVLDDDVVPPVTDSTITMISGVNNFNNNGSIKFKVVLLSGDKYIKANNALHQIIETNLMAPMKYFEINGKIFYGILGNINTEFTVSNIFVETNTFNEVKDATDNYFDSDDDEKDFCCNGCCIIIPYMKLTCDELEIRPVLLINFIEKCVNKECTIPSDDMEEQDKFSSDMGDGSFCQKKEPCGVRFGLDSCSGLPEIQNIPSENANAEIACLATWLDCIKEKVIDILNVVELDFYNDWVNGSLYAFPFKYKLKVKKRRRTYEKFPDFDNHPTHNSYDPFVQNQVVEHKKPQEVYETGKLGLDPHIKNIIPSIARLFRVERREFNFDSDQQNCNNCENELPGNDKDKYKLNKGTKRADQTDHGFIKEFTQIDGSFDFYYPSVTHAFSYLQTQLATVDDNNILYSNGLYPSDYMLFATDITELGSFVECDIDGDPYIINFLNKSSYNIDGIKEVITFSCFTFKCFNVKAATMFSQIGAQLNDEKEDDVVGSCIFNIDEKFSYFELNGLIRGYLCSKFSAHNNHVNNPIYEGKRYLGVGETSFDNTTNFGGARYGSYAPFDLTDINFVGNASNYYNEGYFFNEPGEDIDLVHDDCGPYYFDVISKSDFSQSYQVNPNNLTLGKSGRAYSINSSLKQRQTPYYFYFGINSNKTAFDLARFKFFDGCVVNISLDML